MLKELLFRLKVKRLDEIHVRQYLERQGFEIIYLNSERGQQLTEKLEIKELDDDSFVYDVGRFKYVFLGQTKNDDDKLMVLLHECGHIELKHKTVSKYNEAQAWSFAYNLTRMHFKILKLIFVMLLSATVTFFFMNVCTPDAASNPVPAFTPAESSYQSNHDTTPPADSQEDVTIEENVITDTVYVTQYGEKFHTADCRYVANKNVTALSRSQAQNDYSPCKVCIHN